MMRGIAIAAVTVTTFAVLPGRAPAAERLPASVLACQAETVDERRLACYDREIARWATTPEERFGLRAEQAPPPRPAGKNSTQSAAAGDRQERTDDELESIASRVTAIARRPRGEYVLTLENGQVWAQTQAGSRVRLRVGDEVTVRSAAFGSYLLSGPRGGSTRVERIR